MLNRVRNRFPSLRELSTVIERAIIFCLESDLTLCLRWFLAVRFDPCAMVPRPSTRRKTTHPAGQAVEAPAPAAEERPSSTERELVVQEDAQIVALKAYAMSLGHFVQKKDTWVVELAHSIGQRIMNREGGFIYQSAAYHLPCFPKECALQLFPDSLITTRTARTITWRAPQQTRSCACSSRRR